MLDREQKAGLWRISQMGDEIDRQMDLLRKLIGPMRWVRESYRSPDRLSFYTRGRYRCPREFSGYVWDEGTRVIFTRNNLRAINNGEDLR